MSILSELTSSTVQPLTLHFLGNLLTFRARGTDTGGRFSLIDCLTAPGQGSPPHNQTDEEAFLVLSGRFEFLIGTSVSHHGEGDFVYVPAGTAHAFRNIGEAPGRLIILNLPAGMHEGFFMAVGDKVEPSDGFPPMGAPDVVAIGEAAARFGLQLLPMPA